MAANERRVSFRSLDWPERLERFLADRRRRRFIWGRHDCALFAADWVYQASGLDPAVAFRGAYSDRAGARRALLRIGWGTLELTVTAVLGEPLATPRLAQRGDIALLRFRAGLQVGICTGAKVIFLGEAGLIEVPLEACSIAWRVRKVSP